MRWQKPEKVIERLVFACSDPGDLVFGGVATVPGVWLRHGRSCVSTESYPEIHAAGTARLEALRG